MGIFCSSCVKSPAEESRLLRPRRVIKLNYKQVDQRFLRYLMRNIGNDVVFIAPDEKVVLTTHDLLSSGIYILDEHFRVKAEFH